MNKEFDTQKEKFYIEFWGKVEQRMLFKLIFALIYGINWALFAVLMSVLLLRDVDFKWTLLLVGFTFIVSIILSPFQYKRFSKSYHSHKNYHRDKHT